MTDLTALSDESLRRAYESIRDQVTADSMAGGTYRFMGQAARNRAKALLNEINRRGLRITPIHWTD
jgi:2-phospho-L-lactate guanylyltransferase (CobY/MobA/RfbA family)